MKIAPYNQRITIERNSVVVDAIGNHKTVWEDYYTCFAYVSASSYKEGEHESAGLTVQEENLTFRVRYCSAISKINAGNFRIRFQDNIYNITSIDWMNYQNESVKIKADKERSD